MKSISLFIGAMLLVSTQAFAITRVVECTKTADSNLYLTIVLRNGNATLFECEGSPCKSASIEPVSLAV